MSTPREIGPLVVARLRAGVPDGSRGLDRVNGAYGALAAELLQSEAAVSPADWTRPRSGISSTTRARASSLSTRSFSI